MSFSYRDRKQILQTCTDQTFDLVVIGGGITGVGVAREASMRGLSVLLLEQGDLAEGTSSRSSKLIHGGLRYLEQFQFGLVFESVSERRKLRRLAPHLVRPLAFLFPVYEDSRHGLLAVSAAMWMYDALACFRNEHLHKTLGVQGVLDREGGLRSEGLKGGVLYYDAMADDARLVLETAISAADHGASILTRARVHGFGEGESERVDRVLFRDLDGGGDFEVRARMVVSATGPWTDRVLGELSGTESTLLRPTKGVHLVLSPGRLPLEHAVVVRTRDGRIVFVLPWKGQVAIGTTDTDFSEDPSAVGVDAADIEYLLPAVNACFPEAHLVPEDVVGHWAGVRPLLREEGVGESEVSREHEIVFVKPNLVAVVGGKLTTYRLMSEEVLDEILPSLSEVMDTSGFRKARSDQEVLPGAPDWEVGRERETAYHAQMVEEGLGDATAVHLLEQYGVRAPSVLAVAREVGLERAFDPIVEGLLPIRAEIAYGVEEEMVLSAADLLDRRLSLRQRHLEGTLQVEEEVECLVRELRS
ncbi:MAG: glycerol-3-phosphate dehydrogenase [Planctomycetota bacterium]|nr:glycerol-3-phosphate dehydrogenase [Planctomycetota bacterium]